MEETCGSCRFFRATGERDDGKLGICRLEKVMGVFREAMRACPSFSVHGDPHPPVVVDSGRRGSGHRRSGGRGGVATRPPRVSSGTLGAVLGNLSPEQLKAAIAEVLAEEQLLAECQLGRHWVGGQITLVPVDAALKPKLLNMDLFFHKMVMIRDNLRVMEQKVNSHAQLHDAEKLDLQGRVNLCYSGVAQMGVGWLAPNGATGPIGEAGALLRQLIVEVRFDGLTSGAPRLSDRWMGGQAQFVCEANEHAEPLEVFFHRLLVLRDRLRALEAEIEAHAHIAPDEADAMCGYIRRCYGTLTTFNALFHNREDYFTSTK